MFNVSQFAANTLITAAGFTLVGVSFWLIYRPMRFFHFAHAAIIPCGAYSAHVLCAYTSLSLELSALLSVLVCGLLGCGVYVSIYRRLLIRNASPLILLLASLGTYVVLTNIVSMVFGDGMLSVGTEEASRSLDILGAFVSTVQVAILVTTALVVAGLLWAVYFTRFGLMFRAVSSDRDLAISSGVNVEWTYVIVFIVGSGVAGLAGVLFAVDTNMTPIMGMYPFMMGVVAVIIGGVSSLTGTAWAALLLALTQHASVWLLGAEWQELCAFTLLLVFLFLKPTGVLGAVRQ